MVLYCCLFCALYHTKSSINALKSHLLYASLDLMVANDLNHFSMDADGSKDF